MQHYVTQAQEGGATLPLAFVMSLGDIIDGNMTEVQERALPLQQQQLQQLSFVVICPTQFFIQLIIIVITNTQKAMKGLWGEG